MATPISINASSGQIEANFLTLYLPSGDYTFDLEISNGASSKVYEKIGSFTLVDKKPYEADPEIGSPYTRMIKVGDENVGTSLTGTASIDVLIERTADAPNKVIMMMVDKNGVPFNPKKGEIERRPYPGTNVPQPFLQTMQDYALGTDFFDDRTEFKYGTIPFPLASLGNGFNYYYRIPAQYFTNTNAVAFPEGTFSANPRFVFRTFVPGTYKVTLVLKTMIHK